MILQFKLQEREPYVFKIIEILYCQIYFGVCLGFFPEKNCILSIWTGTLNNINELKISSPISLVTKCFSVAFLKYFS